jgi:hypothetical protein
MVDSESNLRESMEGIRPAGGAAQPESSKPEHMNMPGMNH